MLPGKKYAPEDLLHVLRQRVWWLLVPFALVSAITAVVARKLPDYYRSETTIMVVPQRVPEDYVKPTVTTRLEDRLQAIAQQILSRTRLEKIINDFNLYQDERRTGIMEDVVEGMRKDIVVDVRPGGETFMVAYVGDSPRTAQQVTERLATLFIDENMRDREVLAEGTDQFLEAQLEDARRNLVEREKKLEEYRRQYQGQLPSQAEANLQALRNIQQQVQVNADSINRDRDRRLVIERQLGDLGADLSQPAAPPPPPPSDSAPDPLTTGTTAQRLAAAKAQLAALQMHYTDAWPDVKRMKTIVSDLQKQFEKESLAQPVSAAGAVPLSPAEAARQRRISDLRAEMAQIDEQMAAKQKTIGQLQESAKIYQARIDAVPTRESELAELTRDYSTLQSSYTSLLAKKQDSQIAANLERRQIGEQFKLLDPARIPEKPFSPDRVRINILGMIGGLAVGVGLIVLLEYRDTSFKKDQEVTALLDLPVLAVVPFMQSDRERRSATRRRWLVGVGLGSTVALCMAVLAYSFIYIR